MDSTAQVYIRLDQTKKLLYIKSISLMKDEGQDLMTNFNTNNLMTLAEVWKELRVTRDTFYRCIRHEIPVIAVGVKKKMIKRSDLEAWMTSRTEVPIERKELRAA